jgi:hypothetical protein
VLGPTNAQNGSTRKRIDPELGLSVHTLEVPIDPSISTPHKAVLEPTIPTIAAGHPPFPSTMVATRAEALDKELQKRRKHVLQLNKKLLTWGYG